MAANPTPDLSRPKTVPYSFWNLIRDALIVLLASLPESSQRISLWFTDKPLFPLLEEKGVSVSWLLLFTVPLGLLLFFKTHRTKAKEEAIFLADRFPKNAPVLLFAVICAFFLLVLHGCNLSSENSHLQGELSFATNPPSIFSTTNTPQIRLSDTDFSILAEQTKKFAASFTKTNGNPPKVKFILYPTSTNSRLLLRQFKDAVEQAGWDFEIDKLPMAINLGQGVWVYSVNPNEPTVQFVFWQKILKKCLLQNSFGFWGQGSSFTPGKEDVVIIINDPDYFGE